MRIESVYYYHRAPLRMTARNQKRGCMTTWLLSVEVCILLPPWFAVLQSPSIHHAGDELPFDENIPLAGCKEQDEEEDEETIGDV